MEFVAREDNLGITKEAYIVESSYLDPQYFGLLITRDSTNQIVDSQGYFSTTKTALKIKLEKLAYAEATHKVVKQDKQSPITTTCPNCKMPLRVSAHGVASMVL